MDQSESSKKKIIVAPLNWGLGHATRCIPIINALIDNNFEPIIASDGSALVLLQKEFPRLKSYQLPSYNIRFSKGNNLKYKLFLNIPRFLITAKKEREVTEEIVVKENVAGIISDNRFGVRSIKIPSVYITHQLNVFSGNTTSITSKFHQRIISKFDECWVPDNIKRPRLTGDLSDVKKESLNVKFVGTISRFIKKQRTKKYDLLVVLSGPEPQRSILENKLLVQLKEYDKKVLLVRGVISYDQVTYLNEKVEVVNYMLTEQLQQAFNESELILSRSGYSTIMDLAKLEKKAFFIPTPGQFEQEYLAKRMDEMNIAPFSHQDHFELSMIEKVKNYTGFRKTENEALNSELFKLF
ncbi:MAG: glycosyltransferase [Aureibaculum sp.]|nr:glycosyltransferase [Aureibaculum sp.]